MEKCQYSECFAQNFFNDDPTFFLDTIIGVTNIYMDDSFMSKEESDSMYKELYEREFNTFEFSPKYHDQYLEPFLCMKNNDGFYMIDQNDFDALISARYSIHNPGGSSQTDTYYSEVEYNCKEYIDSIYFYDNMIYTFESPKDSDSLYKRLDLWDLTGRLQHNQNVLPIDTILVYLLKHNYFPFINSTEVRASEISLDLPNFLKDRIKLYMVPLDQKASKESDITNYYYLIIKYKDHYFLCESCNYITWNRLLDYLFSNDTDPISGESIIPYTVYQSVIHTIDSINQFKWIKIGNYNFSPKLYKRLSDAGKN